MGLPYRILNINLKKELLRSLWVGALINGIEFGGILDYNSDKEPIKAPTVCSFLGLGFRVLELGMLGGALYCSCKKEPPEPYSKYQGLYSNYALCWV